MTAHRLAEPFPSIDRPAFHPGAVEDLRFRALLGETEWAKLPAPIRRRFSKRLGHGATAVYVGEVLENWMSRAGWLLVHLARLVGGPLPTCRDIHVPSIVSVTEDAATGGQIWTRVYARRNRFPQVIHSAKRFAGRTGLEEYVGRGIGMALRVSVVDGALMFSSDHYFVALGRWHIPLPAWLCPGKLTVSHAELGDGRFRFTLEIVHPLLGLLLRQVGAFREAHS